VATNLNYTSLLADVQNYLERGGSLATDQTVFNQIPRLINAAERKLAQIFKLLGQKEVLVDAPAGLQLGNPVVTKPDRWRSTVSINYGSGTDLNSRVFLVPRSYDYCRSYWPDSTVTDPNNPPLMYADYDLFHWLIAPTPPQNYPFEAICYMQPPLLDANNQNNFWTELTPNALLYATLCEAEPFIKEDPRLQLWQQMLGQEVQTLNPQDLQRILDSTAVRSGP
jgi:hypothetical protein